MRGLHRLLAKRLKSTDVARVFAAPPVTRIAKKPNPLLQRTQPGINQIATLTQFSLWDLRRSLERKQMPYPYASLNRADANDWTPILVQFQKNLYAAHRDFWNGDKDQQLSEVVVTDYLWPRMSKILAIMYLIYFDMCPPKVAELLDANTKAKIVTAVLSKLFHQAYLEGTLAKPTNAETVWDVAAPHEWFPQARKMKRKIVMHVGPTNSGKTYNSLQALKALRSGYYAGPLRLLAREVYERFQKEGVSCNLITGEEVIPSIDRYGNVAGISSGTIEMLPLHKKMDICVIDEIQMIVDERRGFAWTDAFLGVQAKEVHLCGEPSAVKLIRNLVKATGDELEVRNYERLGELRVQGRSVGLLDALQRGDCVVAFSKRLILNLKLEIERQTKLRVGVIYGALPPEIRSLEAQKFNNGEYDVLVASDAVGMGLNLKIRRIVFYATKKFNGSDNENLSVSTVKQIAGRAGRYVSGERLVGHVTAMTGRDLRFVEQQLKQPTQDIAKACIRPPNEFWVHHLLSFSRGTSLKDAMIKFERHHARNDNPHYFLSLLDKQVEVLELITERSLHDKLTIEDQLTMCQSPLNLSRCDPLVKETVVKFFESISRRETRNVFDYGFLHGGILQREPSLDNSLEQVMEMLKMLETDHKLVMVFMWLSQRYPTLFSDKEGAFELKTLIEKRISEELVVMRKLAGQGKRKKRAGHGRPTRRA